jgi:hypothetical protein
MEMPEFYAWIQFNEFIVQAKERCKPLPRHSNAGSSGGGSVGGDLTGLPGYCMYIQYWLNYFSRWVEIGAEAHSIYLGIVLKADLRA